MSLSTPSMADQLVHFCTMLQKWMNKSARESDKLALFGSASTTDNVRYNLQMLKKSKNDTLVDVVAAYPQLKTVPAVMELVSQDFRQYMPKSKR